ncbi:MAG: AGE family epimerase/isomerase [Lachnospiraceae bacterium]|nr:AGE family epimerase/isomerase [Lachnospiraceae bacterium]
MFAAEIEKHLTKDLIPFWQNLKDEQYGGFYGYMDYDLQLDKKAVKGCILNSRILWFFSNAYMLLKDERLLADAGHAFLFLKEHCMDRECGGVYWSLTYDGKPEDTTKHTYNQAFAIYALSSYYDASKDEEALAMAKELYQIIETKCKDEYGYLEAFNRRFEPEENDKLSENGVIAEKTMNTLLHVFEAYTELYRVTHEKCVADQLRFMMDIIADRVYNKEIGRQEVFFDRTWNTLIDLYSYGHDIETAWLADRGLEVLNDPFYTEKLSPITKTITKNIYDRAYMDHSLVNEAENGIVDTTRVWWVQAEAVVGFVNGYQKSGQKEYLEAAEDIWNYIKTCLIDERNGSEWFWAVDKDRKPLEKPIVEPWKCPYHNGRMCFEVIRRIKHAS